MDTSRIEVTLPPFFLNQSREKTYQTCDRLYAWVYLENLVPDRPRAVLALGTAIHHAQVVAHEKGGSAVAYADATVEAVEVFRSAMKTEGPSLIGDEAAILDGVKTIERLLPAYRAHWEHLGQVWKPLGQELEFCVEVGEGTNVWLVGRIDNLVSFMNSLWLVDYKTMGRLDMRDFLKYEMDIQLTSYIYGGTKQLSLEARKAGKPPVQIRGAIIDGLVKTQIPQFHRELYTRSVEDLRQFELEFCQKAWEIAAKRSIVQGDKALYDLYCEKLYELGRSSGWKTTFPKNTQQCFQYGTCSHRDLCVKDNDVRRMSFKQRDRDYVDAKALSLSLVPEQEEL